MNRVVFGARQPAPSKIVCVGRNYVGHIQELGNEMPDQMVIFLKPNSAVGTHLQAIRGEPLHYEAELSFLFEQGAFTAVAVGLDLTRRQLQDRLKAKGLPWERAKAFDGAALFSEFKPFGGDFASLGLELAINDQPVQSASVALMIYKPLEILAEVQTFMTLADGDIVMTGTPQGVGVIQPGDRFTGRVLQHGQPLVTATWLAR